MKLIFFEGKNRPADYESRARSRENDATADEISNMELSDELDIYPVKGAFNNYVDKRGWVGGQLNVYAHKVKDFFLFTSFVYKG